LTPEEAKAKLAAIELRSRRMATPDLKSAELKLDPDKLYREEVFTDRRIGTLRRLTPVTKDGKTDAARAVVYVGETQIMTPAGSIPIGFEIGAGSLEEAAEKFGPAAKEAIDRTVRELQELRRQASSSIVVPQGPLGGGGKIQLP
jgi:ribosomal protein S5